MCSEHNIFVRVVDRRNLITVGRVWSSRYSHTVCLTSTDHPHEALDLISSSWMLVRCRALSTVDTDRTPSIDVCWLLKYFGSLAKMVERLMKLSLKFGGLTTLVAHLHTSRTPGKNPRWLTENPAPTLVSFLSFSLESFWTSYSCTRLPHTHYSLSKIFMHAPPPFLF